MRLTKFSPDSRLAGMIRFYWFLEGESEGLDFKKIMPFGALDLVIHRGTPMALSSDFKMSVEPMAFVEGQYMTYQYKRPGKKTALVGVSIYPWASEVLFDNPSIKFTGQLVELDALDPNRFNELIDLVQEPCEKQRLVNKMDAFFIREITTYGKQNHASLRSISTCLLTENEMSIQEVAEKHWGNSVRSLQIKFKEVFGLTLSEFRRKARFQKAVELMNRRNTNLTQVALEAGFFDQAHFTKTFKGFTGIQPKNYLSEAAGARSSTLMGELFS